MSHDESGMVEVLRRLLMVMALERIKVNKAEIRLVFSYSHYNAGSTMSQTMSRWLINVETRVQSRANPCEIYGGRSGTGTGSSPSTEVFTRQ